MLNQLSVLFRSLILVCLLAALPSVSPGAAIGAFGHYFKRPADDSPMILLNSDQAYWMVTFSQFDYVSYLDQMSSYGMNFVRIYPGAMPIEDSINYKPPLYADILPWVRLPDGKYDLDQWNEAFFERLRSVVAYANSKGVVVDICFFNGLGSWWRDMWRHMPMNPALNDKIPPSDYLGTPDPYWFVTLVNPILVSYQEKYVREVIRRLHDFDNVIYDIADEPDAGVNSLPVELQPKFLADMKLWVERMLQVAHDEDVLGGNKHLIAETYATKIPDMSWDQRTGWVSLEYRAAIANVGRLWNRNKPLGHVESLPVNLYPGNITDAIRVESWETLTAGAASYLQFNDSCSVANPTGNALTPQILKNLNILKWFIGSFKFWRMSPNTQNVDVAMSSEQSYAHYSSLAEVGKRYAVYLHVSKTAGVAYEPLRGAYTAVVTLRNVPPGPYQVEWVKPLSGRILSAANRIHAGGDMVLDTPQFSLDTALRVMNLSVAKPVVTVTAIATGEGESAPRRSTFRVDRTGSVDNALDVSFWLTHGSAVPGSDATTTENRVTFPAGANSVTIAVSPPADPPEAASTAVVLTLFGAAGYRIGTPFSSSVSLDDSDAMP